LGYSIIYQSLIWFLNQIDFGNLSQNHLPKFKNTSLKQNQNNPKRTRFETRKMSNNVDVVNIATFELGSVDNCSPFQMEMYFTDNLYESFVNGIEYDSIKDKEEIPSSFYGKIKKTNMAVDILDKMIISPGSDREYNFSINRQLDFLLYVYMSRMFPGYKVKEKLKDNLQIRWTHKVGTCHIDNINLMIDGVSRQTITSKSLDIYGQYFMKSGFRKKYRQDIGDEKYLQDWSNELRPFSTKVPLPFFFSKKRNNALPLFLSGQSKIEIKGIFRNKISELLKMRSRKDVNSPWEEIEFKWQYLQGVNDQNQKILGEPELFAYYSKTTEEEKSAWIESIEKNSYKSYKMYYEDIIINSPDKYFGTSEPYSDDLMCKTPSKCIFWVAQDVEGLKYNNYSNYTNNPLDIKSGDYPITKISMKHGTNSRFENLDPSHFDSMMAYSRFPSTPYEKGYGALAFSPNPIGTDADIGPIFDKTNKTSLTLSFKRDSADLYISDVNEDDLLKSVVENSSSHKSIDNQKYKIYVCILAMKKIEFYTSDKIHVSDGNEKINPN